MQNIKNKSTTSYRKERVAALINMAVIEYFKKGRLIDQRLIDMPCTITKVEVTSDLKIADCYFVPFNTKLSAEEVLDAFYASKYAIRAYVTERVKLKYSPKIRFFYDLGFDNARIVDELLSTE